jgi:hypothetical protein
VFHYILSLFSSLAFLNDVFLPMFPLFGVEHKKTRKAENS